MSSYEGCAARSPSGARCVRLADHIDGHSDGHGLVWYAATEPDSISGASAEGVVRGDCLVRSGDPVPVIHRQADGMLAIEWPPGPRPRHVAVTPELLEQMVLRVNSERLAAEAYRQAEMTRLARARAPRWRRWAAR